MQQDQIHLRPGWNILRLNQFKKAMLNSDGRIKPWIFRFRAANLAGQESFFQYMITKVDIKNEPDKLPQIIKDLIILYDTKEWFDCHLTERNQQLCIDKIRPIEGKANQTDTEERAGRIRRNEERLIQ